MRWVSRCARIVAVAILSSIALTMGCSFDLQMKKRPDLIGGEIAFEGISAPKTDDDKRKILASPSVTINGSTHRINYNVLMRSGDVYGGNIFGQIYDQYGKVVMERDGSRFISNDNDFSSLIPVGGKLFNITHFESRPGAMYLTELKQDPATGILTPISTRNIDFSDWGGLWVPCAGSVTPWNSHLGSEEYPPNARAVELAESPDQINDYYKPMLRYFGILDPFDKSLGIDTIKSNFNPYRYGYPVEVIVNGEGSTRVEKRLAMGRLAVELAYVMPDQRTAYISDDGENVGLFLFVADQEGDLGAGKLYAARWIQMHAENGGAADLEWIDLGHATQAEIQTAIDRGVKFSDIFDTADPKKPLPAGFTSINAYNGDGAATEFLRPKPGMEKIASRIETRRYAAILGATTELRKEEGIAYDPIKKVLYVAMSEIARGMENYGKSGKANEAYDKGGPNHVRLPYNDAGCVYGLHIGTDPKIGSDYVARDMFGVVCGEMKKYPADSPFAKNTADIDKIANPDNLTFLPGYKTLIIGEDTGSGHQNDVIWAFNTETQTLTRIQTTPYGSETTSPYLYPDINGWSYIMSVVQHPYGESDEDKLADPSDARAYVGYIGPMPALR
jgi:secreted PhoX family phosphatase